jgi:hypothetical protein
MDIPGQKVLMIQIYGAKWQVYIKVRRQDVR